MMNRTTTDIMKVMMIKMEMMTTTIMLKTNKKNIPMTIMIRMGAVFGRNEVQSFRSETFLGKTFEQRFVRPTAQKELVFTSWLRIVGVAYTHCDYTGNFGRWALMETLNLREVQGAGFPSNLIAILSIFRLL